MSFIVQQEVAQDYVALAPQASFLSNWARLFATVKKLETIPASQFFPQPKVNGAIIMFTPLQLTPDEKVVALQQSKIIELAFRTPRKTLWNNLRAANRWEESILKQAWEKLGLSATARPAELTAETWKQLVTELA